MRGNASARIGNADPRRKEVRALCSRGEIVPPLRGSGDAGASRRWRGGCGSLTRRGAGFPRRIILLSRVSFPREDGLVSAFRAPRERAPEARHNPKNPMREHGENRTAEKKKSLEEAAQLFPFPRGREEMRQGCAKTSPKMCLQGHFFFQNRGQGNETGFCGVFPRGFVSEDNLNNSS